MTGSAESKRQGTCLIDRSSAENFMQTVSEKSGGKSAFLLSGLACRIARTDRSARLKA